MRVAQKYCPACDEEYEVDEEETTCSDCGGPLEAAAGGNGDEGDLGDEEEEQG